MAAVFGADVPAEAGPSFVGQLMGLIDSQAYPPDTTILLEQPWMVIYTRPHFDARKLIGVPFEDQWPLYRRNQLNVAALNAVDTVFIMLPDYTIQDFENGHRHSIIEQSVIAMGLKRTVIANNFTALGTFVSRRVEESPP